MIANNGAKSNGKVAINGKTYQTVAYRLAEFRKQYPIESGWSIETKCLQCNGEKIIFQANIKNPEGKLVASGHAEEKRDESYINRTSALENAETSAIGRALASAGFIGSEFASAEELVLALNSQAAKGEEESKAQETAPKQAKEPSHQAEEQAIPAKQSQAKEAPDEAKAEQWAREHLAEWLNAPCTFTKAQGRTWRELAENKGDKIMVNGKPGLPRAYLHALANWTNCGVWQRTKAKVVLEVIESKNGTHSPLAKAGR